jgi:hypothetical protein
VSTQVYNNSQEFEHYSISRVLCMDIRVYKYKYIYIYFLYLYIDLSNVSTSDPSKNKSSYKYGIPEFFMGHRGVSLSTNISAI